MDEMVKAYWDATNDWVERQGIPVHATDRDMEDEHCCIAAGLQAALKVPRNADQIAAALLRAVELLKARDNASTREEHFMVVDKIHAFLAELGRETA